MLGLRVQLNRDPAVTAGMAGPHALSAIATSAVRDPRYQLAEEEPSLDLTAHLGAVWKSSEGSIQGHVRWLERRLKVGDVITISIVDVPASEVSKPDQETTYAEAVERGERARLAYLIKKYGMP